MSKFITLATITFLTVLAHAQNGTKDQPQMADFMRSNGKIYVVVAVVVTILLGLFIYLFGLDRKIKKIEDSQTSKRID